MDILTSMLVITGPTASGKTKRAVDVAHVIKGEIISADSRQLYKSMDIGTGKDLDDYFGAETLKYIVKQPLSVTETEAKYDVICTVKGGGFTGQAGAIRHGISRALLEVNSDEFRPSLKSNGFLTRDSRMKERKKYGLKKARKAPQFSKR